MGCSRRLLLLAAIAALLHGGTCCPFLDKLKVLEGTKKPASSTGAAFHRRSLLADIATDDAPDVIEAGTVVAGAEKGCVVNTGTSQPSFHHCLEYDLDGQQVVLAYSTVASPGGQTLLEGALVGLDFNLTAGWLGVGEPAQDGLFAAVGSSIVVAFRSPQGVGAQALAIVGPSTNDLGPAPEGFLANGTSPSASLAGGALVTLFTLVLEEEEPTLELLLSMGTLTAAGLPDATLSLIGTTVNTTLDAGNATGPVINPSGSPSPAPSPKPPSPSGACSLSVGGVTTEYKNCYDVGTSASPAKVYFTVSGGTASVGLNASTSGWAGVGLFSADGMIGTNAMFAVPCTSCASGASAVPALLSGYTPSSFKPPEVAFAGAVAEKVGSKTLVLSFSFPWPAGAQTVDYRFATGRISDSTGELSNLSPHVSIPSLRILNADGTSAAA